jgi:hypothetical protein
VKICEKTIMQMQATPVFDHWQLFELSPDLMLVKLRCEMSQLHAGATRLPVPLDLICKVAQSAKRSHIERLERDIAALQSGAAVSSTAAATSVEDPSFFVLVIALAHHQVCCSDSATGLNRPNCS